MPRTRSLAWSELKIGVMAVAALVLTAMLDHRRRRRQRLRLAALQLKTHFHDVQGLKCGRHRPRRRRRGRQGHRGRARRHGGRGPPVDQEGEPVAHHDRVPRVDRLAEPAGRAADRHLPVDDRHAAEGRRHHQVEEAGVAAVATSRRRANEGDRRGDGAAEGHPRGQGLGRQAVHRRRRSTAS